jgi:hypothetical protein
MYLPTPGGGVQALNAVTGDLVSSYKRTYSPVDLSTEPMRTVALYGDKVFVSTPMPTWWDSMRAPVLL